MKNFRALLQRDHNREDNCDTSYDSTDDSGSTKFSCILTVGEINDTFTVTREYMLINGFEKDEALAAVEAWADGVEALCGTAAAYGIEEKSLSVVEAADGGIPLVLSESF